MIQYIFLKLNVSTSVAILQFIEKDTKILVWNCALHSASDVVFDCCAHAHIGGGGEEGGTARSQISQFPTFKLLTNMAGSNGPPPPSTTPLLTGRASINPDDQAMMNNLKFYSSLPEVDMNKIVNFEVKEAINYIKRQQYEEALLKYIEKEFTFEDASDNEVSPSDSMKEKVYSSPFPNLSKEMKDLQAEEGIGYVSLSECQYKSQGVPIILCKPWNNKLRFTSIRNGAYLPKPADAPHMFVSIRPTPTMDIVIADWLNEGIIRRNEKICDAFPLFAIPKANRELGLHKT
uniref:(California timema) hypothetical protein n=1 Tax=Timema californicum TaxID=61474 RepID=A0A7R9P762_TIMCA|nr:unnamed protein product [Timema californicum]